MNNIDLLKSRKAQLLSNSKNVRKNISNVVDEGSFVEINAFIFNNSDFEGSACESAVITGYATVDGYPVYVVAQNKAVLGGGLSKDGIDKIIACLNKAYESEIPVIYLLESNGVQMREGVRVLESISSLLKASSDLKDVAPQFVIATGDVLGSSALLASNADFTFIVNDACVSYASPSVLSATKNSADKKSVSNSQNGVKTFAVKTIEDAKSKILDVLSVLPRFSGYEIDCDDDFMRSQPSLNVKADANTIISATFDSGKFIKLNEEYLPSIITGIGRVGGISTAGIIMDGGEDGVDITLDVALKIKNFAIFARDNGLPILMFVNCNGIKQDLITSNSPVMAELMNAFYNLSEVKRVTVVYNKAIGLGYSFASKSLGSDYTFAYAGSKISLADGYAGVSATFGTVDLTEVENLSNKYEEIQDSFNAAKVGCVDNIIEPEFTRQYVISALQMIL